MFRLCAVSDSHQRTANVRALANVLKDVDAIAFLGDGARDFYGFSALCPAKLFLVRGNCDTYIDGPSERLETFSGVPMLLTHGDQLMVRYDRMRLGLRAQELGARVALYGHTHHADVDFFEGVLLVNPGALQNGQYAILEIDNGRVKPFLLDLPDEYAFGRGGAFRDR